MREDFSRTLSLLRQEKGVSQRKAAADLGISQALLSHYENGVREPGLNFVTRACDYYNVSADFMLGRTMSRDGAIIVSEDLYDASQEKGSLKGSILATCTNACPFHTRLVRNLLTVCAHKSLQLSQRILHTSSKSIRGRLMSYFSECAKRTGSSSFLIPYNRQQLADYLNVDRSAMCNELSKMQKDGVIEYARNRILLKEQKGLDPLIKPPVP